MSGTAGSGEWLGELYANCKDDGLNALWQRALTIACTAEFLKSFARARPVASLWPSLDLGVRSRTVVQSS